MKHIKLILQYDGTDYSGWQVQKKEKTIQGLIENALVKVTGERTRIAGAGRTDAGVHALHQVAAFHTKSHLKPATLMKAINANLPPDVRVAKMSECFPDFHPRFSAKHKTYVYLISRPGPYSVFLRRYSWQIPYELNFNRMRKAAELLAGKHDFACFRASGCSSKNAVRNIKKISITKTESFDFLEFLFKSELIKISIQADAFLRHMARNIVGTLVEVGRGKITLDAFEDILHSKDRKRSGPTAPAQGLFLEKIIY
jgi:tRNA pseudouridine38-40 synthase